MNELVEVDVQGVSKFFGRRKVLDDVSFQVKKGEFLGIFGPNGAGKTTLLRILSTVVSPGEGEISISHLSASQNPIDVRRKIGFVSHHPLLYLDLTADENLRFYGAMYGVSNLEDRITALLKRVELQYRRHDVVRTFSEGMLQRLAIARSMLHQPSVLLLDEPHSGLDLHAVDILEGLLAEIKGDCASIMVTHNLERGFDFCDSVLILDEGRVVYQRDKDGLDLITFKRVYQDKVGVRV